MDLRLAALLVALACGVAHADARDPPGLVARVSAVSGRLLVENDATHTSDSAAVNWPVTSGDRARTETDSRAELDLGIATVQLDDATRLSIVELDQTVARVRLDSGSITLSIRDGTLGEGFGADPVSVQAAHATIELLEAGQYRIDVVPDGATRIAVRTGKARTSAPTARFGQTGGEDARIAGDGTFAITRASSLDAFDQWSADRARHAGGARASRHVAKGLVGHEDLDAYGTWRWEREYGMVWEPQRVARQWAPYRFGRWIWKRPWGWTWVDDAPWGFAPTHFGRWINIDARWLWVPGPRQIPAVYAPALVRWTRAPTEHELTGWSPLSPGEEYTPPYPASAQHIQALNTFSVVRARAELEPPAHELSARGLNR
jgi:hypothetical protein